MFKVIGFSVCPYGKLRFILDAVDDKDFDEKITQIFPSWTLHEVEDRITYHSIGFKKDKSERLETNCMVTLEFKMPDTPAGKSSSLFTFERMRDPEHPPFFSERKVRVVCVAKINEHEIEAIAKIREIFKDIIVGETESDV